MNEQENTPLAARMYEPFMQRPLVRDTELIEQQLDGELLIYDLTIHKAYCLNETSALVYQFCNGKNTVAEISNLISKKLNQPVTEDLVWLALDGFKKDNLLQQSEQLEIDFNNLSRRQVIKKIGLSSMVMLPLISSIVAPVAAQSLSNNRPLYAACFSSPQCNSGNCLSGRCCSSSSVIGTVGFLASASLSGTCPSTTSALNAACGGFSAGTCCSGTVPVSDGSCQSIGGGFIRTNCVCPSS